MIDAPLNKIICLSIFEIFSGFCSVSSSFKNFLWILFFISCAAAFVKVTINILSTSKFSSSTANFVILSTSTAVFPEPAAAATSKFLFLLSIAFFCCSVQFIKIFPFIFAQILLNYIFCHKFCKLWHFDFEI